MPIFYKKMQSVILDLRISHLYYYQNGVMCVEGQVTPKEGADWCLNNLNEGASVFIIGPTREAESVVQQLSKRWLNVCCYDVKQAGLNRNTTNSQNSMEEVLSSLNEIKDLLKKEPPQDTNYALINASSPQRESKDIKELKSFITNSFEELSKKQLETNYLVTEIYNREPEVSNSGSSEVIEDLRKELASYKNDFYQKSMMKFGVNTAIEILERLYTEKNLLKQKEDPEALDRIIQIISFCEARMKKLNLRVRLSSDGDEFDGSRMVSYDDKVAIDDENMKGRVAYSIFPAIYWTLPRVNAPGDDELLIKEETVALYE